MVQNKKLTEKEFLEQRKEVLASWHTGNDHQLNFEEAIAYLKSVPEHKNFAKKLAKAKDEGSRTLVQPRAGVPVINSHIELMQYLEQSGADFLPSTIDSYTRQNRYKEADKGIEESLREGRALLNGFPAVNHGVTGCKKVLESVNVPLQARHGTPDARLLAEVIHAAGWTSNEGSKRNYAVVKSGE